MDNQNVKPDNIKAMLDNIEPRAISILGYGGDASAEILLVPNGMKAESVKKYLEEYRELPERRKGREVTDRLSSFVDLTNRFKDEHSVVFARGSIKGNKLTAQLTTVLDYHPASSDYKDARYGEHEVFYDFPVSKEFAFWLGGNCEAMSQTDFALLLEERIGEMGANGASYFPEIENLKPKFADPLEILELSQSLEIYSSETVRQAGKLSSGERNIQFTASHNDADGKPISIPDFFMLNIPIFEGEQAIKMAVRLRYRKKGDGVIWLYDLYRVDQVFQVAFDSSLDTVKATTELPLIMGAPSTNPC